MEAERVWHPESVLEAKGQHACIILNRPINVPARIVKDVWENATLRCLVDGGANRWRRFLESHSDTLKPPELITGDFDSVTRETLKFFTDPVTKILHTPDQNATDFTKAIGAVRPLLEADKKTNDIIVLHDTSGRLDQIIANINTLFKVVDDALNIYMLSGNSMTWLLRPGKHSIHIPPSLLQEQRWCALIPIGEKADHVTTHGLKWDLTNSTMEFGGMVSTSNTYSSQLVEIDSKSSLIWSMGMFAFDDV